MKKIVAFIAVLIYMTCTATVWGQTDYTSSIKNAGFDTYNANDKTAANWTFDKVNDNYVTNFTDINNCAEQWNRNFNFYQDVNLPNGLYKVSVQGFYRDGGIGGANAKARKAYLYADEAEIPLMNILDEEGSGVTGGSTVSGYNSTFPNNITEASTAFTNNYYSDNSLYVMVSDGNLRIGIKKDETFDADWVCFDNFKLTYYGNNVTISNPYTGTGKFYLQNVATNEYLQGGGFNGLQAMLGNGIEFELVKKYDGIYHIRNVGINPEGNDYLSDERRLDDQPIDFIITETNEGSKVYNIATQSGFLLTSVAGNSNNGERYKDLNDFTLDEWNGVTPGSTFKQSWTDVYENSLYPKYHSNQVYSKGALVYGTNDENGNVHPNLTGYTTMTIKGTSGSRLKIIFNCEGGANSGAPRKEEVITIGESGYYTIDLTPYGYFHLNAIKVPDVEGATATIESITLDKFDVVDANLGTVQFALWSQAAPGGTRTQLNPQNFYNNVGKTITASNLVYGDAGVWPLNYADLTGYKSIRIKATPEAKLRFLFNREGTNDGESSKGSFDEKIVTIESDGYGFLDLSGYTYVHLNAIKTANDSKEAYIEEIMLSRKNNSVMFLAGADKWNNRSQWRFVTEDQRIQELAGATWANPKNATFLIKNASLTEIDNEPNNVEASPFWKLAEHWYFIQRDGTVHTDGAGGIVNSKTSANDVYQELANLPNGLYEVSMQGCYRNFDNAVFYANGTSVSLDLAGKEFDNCNHSSCNCRMVASVQTYGTNNYKKTLRVVVTDGKLRIGVKGNKNADNNLLIYDNFTLSYLGEVDMMTYYVRNVATGDFIRAGGHYEAQAIRDDWGLAMNFKIRSGGTICSIDSRISNGGDNQYLGTNGFLDSPETEFTLEKVGDYYAIRTADGKYLATADGDDKYVNFDRGVQSSDTHAQWELLTRDQLIEELKKSNASDSNPQDATFLIEGSNLNRHDLRNNDINWKGIDFSSNEYGGVESLDWGSSDNIANSVIEKFNKTFDTYQIISGLPAGVYELTVQGYYRSGNTATAASKTNDGTDILRPFLYVKQGGNLIGQAPLQSIFDGGVSNQTDGFSTSVNGEWLPNSLSDAAKTFRDEYYMPSGECNKVRFVVPSDDATVQIGVKKNVLYDSDWTAFDNFRLTYLGDTDETQTVYEHEIGTTLGTFYLKNAQTETYLTAGGADGVSAVLGDQMHQHSVYNNEAKYQKGVRETDFTFVAVGADKFVIETGIGEGYLTLKGKLNGKNEIHIVKKVTAGNNIGDNEYVVYDPTPKVQDGKTQTRFLKNGGYGTVSDENPATNGNIRWIFQTKADLLAEFPNATESNPIDATFLLRGTAFHKDDSRNSAWTGKPVVGGAESNYVGSASGRTYNISQTLTDLPAGVYEFTLQGYHTNENGINEQARYYVSTDVHQRTLITKNTSGATTFINAKNYAALETRNVVWEQDFTTLGDNADVSFRDNSFTVNGGATTIKPITISGTTISDNLGLEENTSDNRTYWRYYNKALYSQSGGPRLMGFRNLVKDQIIRIKTNDGTAFGVKDTDVLNLVYTTTDEVVLRVLKNGAAGIEVQRYTYIYHIGVYDELSAASVNVSDASTASSLFADAADKGVHPVIRFEVPDDERKMVTLGIFDAIKDVDALYIDNVRLTYLGVSVTGGIATPQKLIRGIRHKRSRYYDLAAENGHLEFVDYNTVNEASNKTTLSNETMVKLNKNSNIMIQHAPVYRDTIYAQAGETLNIVLPSSYTDLAQSSGKYYQRLYNYKTDDMFVEDAANVGKFDLGGSDQGTTYTDADIRKTMEVYEGSMSAPAGGWVFGNRWGQQLVSRFNFTTPTDRGKFKTAKDHAIEIAIDYTDFSDMGDMGMFGDLTEPTLVQRAIFVIVPSDEMVKKLSASTGDKFLEVKSISFPSIWHGLNTNDLNAVALDKQVRNYFTGVRHDVNLDSLVITLTNNGTGITLENGTYEGKFSNSTDRFIKFKYPSNNEVTNYVTEYIYVRTKDNENIAKFILDFVPNTELRPWKDIMGQATLSRSPMYLDNHAQLIDVLNFDKSYRKDGEAVYHPSTWPIGDDTSVNGIERDTEVKNPSQFNPYPLDFDQTTFGAYYPRAIWSQYSVMKRLHSYRDKPEFKDVNQLYHDYFSTQDGTGDLLQKYQGGGYFMYIDASNFPSSIARLTMEEKLCEGTTIHFSGWVSSMDLSTDGGNAPGYLLFSIVGIDARGNETVIESFCPGPIRADGKSYAGETVKYDTYHTEIGWTDSYSIWQQFAFSFVVKADVADKYEEYALKIDNYCSNTSGGDMMVDDVRLYIHKAVPDVMQSVPVCSPGDMSGVEIYTDFDQLLSAVNMQKANSEQDAYNGYVNKQVGGKIIPTAWYCFLDKKKYDDGIAALAGKTPTTADYDAVFNSALVTTGGGTGYHSFTFSTYFEFNNGGSPSFENSYTHTPGTSKQIVSYDAKAGTDGRIYFNPKDYDFEGSLQDFPYMVNNTSDGSGTWSVGTAVWNVGNAENNTIYGHVDGLQVRYVDLEGYDELRIYQATGDPVRCMFFNSKVNVDKNLTVSSEIIDSENDADKRPIKFNKVEYETGKYYWALDLNAVKELTGEVKLIAIKASAWDTSASVTAINVVRKSVELEPSKDYYIVFRAYEGQTGVTSLGGPSTFFNITSSECAAMSEFRLVPNSMARFDGTLDSEGGDKYCAGQIATLKMEMQGFDSNNMAITLEDLPYDWWIGDKSEFMTKASDAPASPNDVLFAFREVYPEATTYEGQEIKGAFTSAYKTAMEQWIEDGKLYLYKTSQNVRVENTGSDGQMEIMVSPILSFLEGLTSFQYCDPIEVYINVSGSAPVAKDGFEGTTYPMDEVPVRIGLSQIQSVKDETANSWLDTNNALYIPLRDINFSGEAEYTNGFGKKKHNWGGNNENNLDIAAVYLTETDDPAMVSYGDDVDDAGNRELRYVGKVHVFQAALNKDKFEDYVKLTFNPDFADNVKEGYRYVLKTSFEETNTSGTANPCHGDLLIPLYIVPEYQVWAGGADGNWANDDNWRRADNGELKFATTDRPTNEDNTTSQGFVPMDFTKVLMKSDSVAVLKGVAKDGDLVKFSDADGHTQDIQYHLAAKVKEPPFSWFPQGRTTDIYCEPFYTNTAKEVHFEPYSQMLNTQYLTYERAWVEYALESGRWYTLSSPLQGVVSGDMYLPRGTAKQETPYFNNITYDNTNYTRLAPAVYQQAWDKAEATTYRLERDELVNKRPPQLESNTATVNVARAFDWSREYNDVKVPFGINGFSVKVDVSRIEDYTKGNNERDVLLRLPKDDTKYDYYLYDDATSGSETADLKNLRDKAGKLFTDGMPAGSMTVTLTNNSADNPYFLVGNPFMSGLSLNKFFEKNDGLENECWILTGDSYSASIKTGEQWASTDKFTTGNVAPLQAFFVKKSDGTGGTLNVTFTSGMAVQLAGDTLLQTRAGGAPATLRLTAMRDGVESRAIVVCREEATEGFSAGEDVEALFDSNLSHAPTLYTAAGEVAAAINVRRTLHGVPVGIGGEDESEVTLTFDGVEQFGEELYLYDAAEGTSTLIPASGTSLSVCGRTTGRYYLVTTPLDGSAQESVPVVSVQGHVVTVLSAFDEILSVEAYDATGRKVYAEGAVGNRTRFTLSAPGVYLITVKTAAGVFSHKVLVNS